MITLTLVAYRNGTQKSSGTPYCQTWQAWVAAPGDAWTPMSNVLGGTV